MLHPARVAIARARNRCRPCSRICLGTAPMVAVSVGQPTQRPYVKIFEGTFSPFEAALRARPTLDSVLLRRNGWTSLCRDNSALYSGLPREMNPLSSRSPKRGWDFMRESLRNQSRRKRRHLIGFCKAKPIMPVVPGTSVKHTSLGMFNYMPEIVLPNGF
jgi:hypothetical protein